MHQQGRTPGPHGLIEVGRAVHGLTSEPAPALDALTARYGPTFVVPAGPMTMAVVGDPAHLRTLLSTTTDAFRWGHRFNVLGFIVGPGSMIVSDGDDWRRRRGATQRGFARRRLDGWVPLIVEETDRLLDEMLLGRGGIGDMYPRGRTLVRRIVVRVLFGDGLGDRADELGEVLEPAMTYGVQSAIRQLPHPLPGTARARARAALRDADRIIYEEIDRRRADAPSDGDVLDLLLAGGLSRTEVRDQIITLIAAGYDTTASAFAWTLLAAARDPEIWSRLRAEADRVFCDETDYKQLVFADAVVRESLRLYPPGLFSPRQAVNDIVLGDITVKRNTMLLWSPYVAGRLASVWDDPLVFNPDRFVEPDARQQDAIDGAWMPFGKGPRACIGFALAQMELALVIARLAQRIDVKLDVTEMPKPEGMVVNRPTGGVHAIAAARS